MDNVVKVVLIIEGTVYEKDFDVTQWSHGPEFSEYMGEHIGELISRTIQQHYNHDQVLPASTDT